MKTLAITSIFTLFSIICFSQDKLYIPNNTTYPTAGSDGIGINEDRPEAALHIVESDDQGTALRLDLKSDQISLPGGGFGNVIPRYAIYVRHYEWGIGTPKELFAIENDGKTRINYFGSTGGEVLSISNSLGVFNNSTNKVNLKYSGSQPEFTWTTSSNKNLRFKNTNNSKTPLSLSPNGKVGINTEDFFDDHDLYVNGSVYINGDSPEGHSIYIEGSALTETIRVQPKSEWANSTVGNIISMHFRNDNNVLIPEVLWDSNNDQNLTFRNSSSNNSPLTLSSSGKVGVNTSDFFDDHELYVDGSVYIKAGGMEDHSLYIEGSSIAEEMYVRLKADWGDFVFHNDYPLLPLSELQDFINENGHLPEMPTAAEVKQKGIETGETIRLLTIKVEELTLYILEQQQEIEALKKNLTD